MKKQISPRAKTIQGVSGRFGNAVTVDFTAETAVAAVAITVVEVLSTCPFFELKAGSMVSWVTFHGSLDTTIDPGLGVTFRGTLGIALFSRLHCTHDCPHYLSYRNK